MAQPQRYDRKHNFLNDDEIRQSELNNEFDNVALSVNGIRDNLALIQADDGNLLPGVVKAVNLDEDVFDRFQDEMVEASAITQQYADSAARHAQIALENAEIAVEAGKKGEQILTQADAVARNTEVVLEASELIQQIAPENGALKKVSEELESITTTASHVDEVHAVGQDLLGINVDYLSLGKVSEDIDRATMVVDGYIRTVALSIDNVNFTGQNIEAVINVSENIDNLNVWLATFEGYKTDAESARDAAQAQASLATDQANLAKEWAVKLDATVDGSEYSSKYYAQQASAQATAASSSASAAATSAQASAASASESASSASSSANSAMTATNQAAEATTQAQAAQAAQTAAEAAQSKAETAAGNAETSATAAAESASTATTQATTATTQAELAATAKTASEAAQAKAEAAQGSAETAADQAKDSATTATGSATTAAQQAAAASSSASDAAASATAAASSAAEAKTAQTAAEAAQAAAEESAKVAADIASGDLPVVRYDAQELTTESKAQARSNIDAAQSSHTHTVTDLPVATSEQAMTGTDTTTVMTPATTKAAIEALSPPPDLSPYATTEAMNTALSGKSDVGHGHVVSDVSGLGALATLDTVSTDNIANGAVTADKLAAGVVSVDNLANTISLGTIS